MAVNRHNFIKFRGILFACCTLEMAFIIVLDVKHSSKSLTFLFSKSFYSFWMYCKQEWGRLSIYNDLMAPLQQRCVIKQHKESLSLHRKLWSHLCLLFCDMLPLIYRFILLIMWIKEVWWGRQKNISLSFRSITNKHSFKSAILSAHYN